MKSRFISDKKDEWKAQKWYKIEKVFRLRDDKSAGYMVELQYIFKTKKEALRFFDKLDKQVMQRIKEGKNSTWDVKDD